MEINDRELLELAAKAAGVTGEWCDCTDHDAGILTPNDSGRVWSPLTDDGDALRLAVKLNMQITVEDESCGWITAAWGHDFHLKIEFAYESPETASTATRRAIVRAAAEIAKGVAKS